MNNSEYCKKWKENNKEAKRVYDLNYYQTHKEQINESSKKYREEHKDELRSKQKLIRSTDEYREHNRTKANERYLKDPSKAIAYGKKYRDSHPEIMRQIWQRAKSKRRGNMGFIRLNEWFEGSEGHHVDNNHVIFIPYDLHKQYWQDHKRPETMTLINVVAWNYLFEQK